MNFTCIGFGIVFIVAGILFAMRKLLPRAWKKMPPAERAKINIRGLCLNIGTMIALCGVIVLLNGLWAAFSGKPFLITMIVWMILCGVDAFYISKSKRYRDK